MLLPLRDGSDAALAGGKAARLSRLIQAGFPVPDGFVVTTEGVRRAGEGEAERAGLEEAVVEAWQAMGSPPVAVRSSATAEDAAEASMAGQYETFLNLRSAEGLLEAVRRCREAAFSERAASYLRGRGLDPRESVMAVLVQRMVPAEVAGVAFSVDPRTGDDGVVVIESAWGLGETVVSGAVQPDTFRVLKETERVEAVVSEKRVWIPPDGFGEEAVPLEEGRRREPSLTKAQAVEVARLTRRLEADAGGPVDVEWAIAGGSLFLLQVRPVTAVGGMEGERKRWWVDEIKGALARGEGPWVRHNLGETLPHPTPLTWSVMERFMSPVGGYGAMLRAAGYAPNRALGERGFLCLIAGKVFMEVNRAVEMLEEGHAFGYDLERLRRDPGAGQEPPTRVRGDWAARHRAAVMQREVEERCRRLAERLPDELRGTDFPEFLSWCREQEGRESSGDPEEWVARWRECESRVWDAFAARAFLPTLVLGVAMARLRLLLETHCWERDAGRLVEILAVAEEGDAALALQAGLEAWGRGEMSEGEWMARFGHRGPGEMELAEARWRERVEEARAVALTAVVDGASLATRHEKRVKEARELEAEVLDGLGAEERAGLREAIKAVRALLPFREDAKDVLMRGHGLLRRLALEAGRMTGSGDGVFFLRREELLEAVVRGVVDGKLVGERKRQFAEDGRIEVPGFLDAESLDQWVSGVGKGGEGGVRSLTRGRASGRARIVRRPEEGAGEGTGFVLVCPSSDTSWTPLFARSAAVVLERGGMLSHGAVVARELGLPAVVMEGACEALREGEWVTVDADVGTVVVGGSREERRGEERLLPVPPPSPAEQRWQRWAGWAAAGWAVLLGLGWVLPAEWLAHPGMRVADMILWPVVSGLGMAWGVVAIAVGTAGLVLLVQAMLADRPRLREVARRAEAHRKRAAAGGAEGSFHAAQAGLGTRRMLGSAMVPLGLLLGPLLGLFLWLPERVAPEVWSPPPGVSFEVRAEVDGAAAEKVRLVLPEGFEVAGATPLEREVPPVRRVLEEVLTRWQSEAPRLPEWVPGEARKGGADEVVRSLERFLERGVTPVPVNWLVKTPEGFEGRAEIRVESGLAELAVPVVMGGREPPVPGTFTAEEYPYRRTTRREGNGPVLAAEVVYPVPQTRPTLIEVGGWAFGWLGLYLVGYLPAMFLFKRVLRLP